MKGKRKRVFNLNTPQGPRINIDLAKEIGFARSIIFLQIEFLISICDHFKDGKWWTYQTSRGLAKDSFPWWTHTTVDRHLKQLIKMELLHEGNYNKRKHDKTRWFAINFEGCRKLKSITVLEREYQIVEKDVVEGEGRDESPETQKKRKSRLESEKDFKPSVRMRAVCKWFAIITGKKFLPKKKLQGYFDNAIEEFGWSEVVRPAIIAYALSGFHHKIKRDEGRMIWALPKLFLNTDNILEERFAEYDPKKHYAWARNHDRKKAEKARNQNKKNYETKTTSKKDIEKFREKGKQIFRR